MDLIWLNPKKHKNCFKTKPFEYSSKKFNYCVVQFNKEYIFDSEIEAVDISFAADTNGIVYINNKIEANTIFKCPDDFILPDRKCPIRYWTPINVDLKEKTKKISIKAFVQLGVSRMYDFSSGHGGFILKGKITLKNKKIIEISTDDTWNVRLEKEYVTKTSYDQRRIKNLDFEKPIILKNDWNIISTDIKPIIDLPVIDAFSITLKPGEKKNIFKDFPVIYSSYIDLSVACKDNLNILLTPLENENKIGDPYSFTFIKDSDIRLLDLYSIGGYKLHLENNSIYPATITLTINHSFYKYKEVRQITTSNKKLNNIFEKCTFAAVNCSQNIYLDSPFHCEPLASCSGDYQIESLVIAFATGNYDLAKHVLRGMSIHLNRTKGRVNNLSYSLVFVQWVYKIYEITGDISLLKDTLPGIISVLKFYKTCLQSNGLIEPYRYCFVDWLVVDGYGLFDPPKALGQSLSNMFYYRALIDASKIFEILGYKIQKGHYLSKARALKRSINSLLYDKDRGLYIEGLSTPTSKENNPLGFVPDNPNKVYYRKHANILAVAYGLQNKKISRQIIHKLFHELIDEPVQPFFMHYFFEAIHRADLDGKYAMKLLGYWKKFVKVKDKGLPEGFYLPQKSYIFDFSHAWACTPYYSFIVASSGLKILKPGMSEISLNIRDLGLTKIDYSIGTPFGFINIYKEKGKEAIITHPKEIIIK